MAARISLGMIVKDEARTLRACLESVAPHVDEIIIGLGGISIDDTEKIAREFTENIFQIEWKDDFADARNQVMARTTGEYYLWLDGDDILKGGEHLREYIQKFPEVDAFFMGYDYGRDEQNVTVCYLIRERLIKRHPEVKRDWEWKGKVHEVLTSNFLLNNRQVEETVVIHHKPANKHEANRNRRILYQMLEEGEPTPDPRILAYLGSENAGLGNITEAIVHWQRFVKLSGWDHEKYQTQHKIGDLYRGLGEFDKAREADYAAIQVLPDWPDAYYGLAETAYHEKKYQECIHWIKVGSQQKIPLTSLIINPLDYSYFPLVTLGLAYTQLGEWELALSNYNTAFREKAEPQLEKMISGLVDEIQLQQQVKNFLSLREWLARHDEWLKVRKLFDSVPAHIRQHPLVQEAWARTSQQTAHVLNPQVMVDFYNDNPHWAPMSDEQILDPEWLKYPRLKYALDVAAKVQAKTVVDWGCSDGFIALPVARAGYRVTGFDLDPRCISLATERAAKWDLRDARFEVGNIDEIGGWEGEKADLAVFFEVIEHVVDPIETLKKVELTAKHIALTTPYLAWENGNIEEWDKVEPKGHLRIFDQFDLEAILTGRGQIMNLYRQAWGRSGWLFADYKVGVETTKTIMLGAMGTIESWNPRTLWAGGLGGSETAIIKLTEAFANLEYRPIVYTDCDEPGYYNGVCYREQQNWRDDIHSDVFIAWRWPEAADLAINTDHLILWMHDTDSGSRITKERIHRFDKVVVLTEWHKAHMMKLYPFIPEEKFAVIGNGVDIERFLGQTVRRNRNRVIYSSSPDRGLDVILEGVWPKVTEAIPDAELHIYYGWNNFDKFAAMPQFGHLKPFKDKIERLILDNKNVVQHGRIPQEQLAIEMQKASIWLYPTYFSETYCITAVEAQQAGVLPITNKLAALAETVGSGVFIEGDVRDPAVQEKYAEAVIKFMKLPLKERKAVHSSVNQFSPGNSWETIAKHWDDLVLQGEPVHG